MPSVTSSSIDMLSNDSDYFNYSDEEEDNTEDSTDDYDPIYNSKYSEFVFII